MSLKKLHFMYDSQRQPNAGFAEELIAEMGQVSLEEADAVICIGGDGLLLQALRTAGGKPVYAITAPGSNSCGFWTDHAIDNAAMLREKLDKADIVPLAPIEAEITFSNGKKVIRHAFNSVAIERASGQAVLMNLTAHFSGVSTAPMRIMGDGFIFSTALGSTGLNRSYGGPAVDVYNNVLILAGKGIYNPRGIAPVVAKAENASFSVDFGSVAHKRPVRIDYDGHSIERDEDGSHIVSLNIRVKCTATAKMMVTNEPGMKALSVLRP